MTGILLQHADVPDLNRIDTYERLGGYRGAAQGADRDDAGPGGEGARGLGPARPRRRRLLDGQEGQLPAPRRHRQVPVLQRRRVRAGHVQGPRADAPQPAPADRGRADRRLRRRAPTTPSSTSAASTRSRPTSSTPRSPRRTRAATSGERILRLGLLVQPRRAPRRRRLHLRRGDGAARLARGQARQPAPEAAVPGQPGPLPGADADQQRRDALQRPAHRRERRRLVQAVRHRALAGHEGRLGLRQRAAPRQLRDRARHPGAGDHLRPGGRPARGAAREGLVPGRLVGPGPDRGAPRPALRLRAHGRGRLDARLGRDHRGRRLRPDRVRRAAPGGVLPPRVVRQVRAVPRGHELDREDAGAHRPRRGDARWTST